MWCIPAKHSAEFVCQMEDVLDVYCRSLDPRRPVVCLDELSRQLVGEVRMPLPSRPGRAERYDCEYVRNGTPNLFMAFELLGGWPRCRSPSGASAATEHPTPEARIKLRKLYPTTER